MSVTTIRAGLLDVPAAELSTGRPAATYPIWGLPFDDGAFSVWPTLIFVPRPAWGATVPPPTAAGYWPPEHDPIRFITVHHTATANRPPDPAAVVRAIHYYHTYTLDRGNIGYHFLIDPWGTIYQGRGGGADAVAGHVYAYNRFNLGISLLGQFQPEAPDVPEPGGEPTEAALASLVSLAGWAARRYAVEPGALVSYPLHDRRDGPFPTVQGQRDWHDGVHRVFPDQPPPATACPGEALYRRLDDLRGEIAAHAARAQPSRLVGTLAAFAAYETYAPGAVRGDFAYGPNPGLAPSVRFHLDVRSRDAHEAGAGAATGRFEMTDEANGLRYTADRIGFVGIWEEGLARGAFVRGAGRTGVGEPADFSLSLTEDAAGATVRLWLTSGPPYQTQGSLLFGSFRLTR